MFIDAASGWFWRVGPGGIYVILQYIFGYKNTTYYNMYDDVLYTT